MSPLIHAIGPFLVLGFLFYSIYLIIKLIEKDGVKATKFNRRKGDKPTKKLGFKDRRKK